MARARAREVIKQLPLLRFAERRLATFEAGDQRLIEHQAHAPNSSFSCEGLSSGASWSKVHCCGLLSGRQRTKPVPWRKRRPVTWS